MAKGSEVVDAGRTEEKGESVVPRAGKGEQGKEAVVSGASRREVARDQ